MADPLKVEPPKADPLKEGDPHRVGPFRLKGRLGTGGMGQVFLGRTPGGRPVAVKLVPSLANDPDLRRRFATEVDAARRVGGFYTAQVVDADPDGDPPWLATAYIAGPSLERSMLADGPLPAASIASMGAGLAEGLAAVHAHGLVHRDLKPGNVILAEDGPRLIDFGIARALEATTSYTRTVLGTAAYMSPEQATGGTVGPASDIFALGCVLAFAATGRSPFGSGTPEAVAYRIVHADPDLSGVPFRLVRAITACLEKKPGKRPTAETMVHRLARLAPDPDRGTGHRFPGFVGRAARRVSELVPQQLTNALSGETPLQHSPQPPPPTPTDPVRTDLAPTDPMASSTTEPTTGTQAEARPAGTPVAGTAPSEVPANPGGPAPPESPGTTGSPSAPGSPGATESSASPATIPRKQPWRRRRKRPVRMRAWQAYASLLTTLWLVCLALVGLRLGNPFAFIRALVDAGELPARDVWWVLLMFGATACCAVLSTAQLNRFARPVADKVGTTLIGLLGLAAALIGLVTPPLAFFGMLHVIGASTGAVAAWWTSFVTVLLVLVLATGWYFEGDAWYVRGRSGGWIRKQQS